VRRFDANPVILFTITLFASATLLFLVEPMVAKMLLPKFGGTPAVWATCMVFFQTALLAGYAYAHAATKYMSLRQQIVAQIGLLTAAVLVLPLLRLSVNWEPPGDAHPAPWVLLILTGAIGLPFFVMSTSAPLLQKWFSETGHPSAKDPYFLYAASNVGSMATLLLYPFLVEPELTIPWQNYVWMAGYVALLGATLWCGYLVWFSPAARKAAKKVRVLETVPAAATEKAPQLVAAGETAIVAKKDASAETDTVPLSDEKKIEEPAANGAAEEEEEEGADESVAITAEAPAGGKRKKRKGGWREAITRKPAIKPTLTSEQVTAQQPPPREPEPAPRPLPPTTDPDRPSVWTQLHWIALAFVPSSLFIGVTTYMTTDIASLPLLWIIPLALYLLTFIIVFSQTLGPREHPIVHQAMVLTMPVLVLLLVFVMVSEIKIGRIEWLFLLHLATLFVVSMVCHGELARNRPGPRHLTGFYLCMSIGGTLGGVFNALVAPVVFQSVAEYTLVIVIACMLLPPMEDVFKMSKLNRWLDILLGGALGAAALYCVYKFILWYDDSPEMGHRWLDMTGFASLWEQVLVILLVTGALLAYAFAARKQQRLSRWLDVAMPLSLGLLTAQLIHSAPFRTWGLTTSLAEALDVTPDRLSRVLTYGLPVALCYGFAEQPIRFGLGVGAIFLAGVFNSADSSYTIHQDRSFFGVLKVETRDPYDDPLLRRWQDGTIYNRLLHGTTLHGMQRQPNMPLLMLPLTATNPYEAAAYTSYGRQESDSLRLEALTYYHRTGPIGQVYSSYCSPGTKCDVAFIGLGTGTMSSYLEPGQHGDIYEIDRKVVDIASNERFFTYLRDARGPYDIRLGDARLKLKDAAPHSYKLIVVDAFSSDAIPVHLITKEAVELYFDKLTPDGVLAVHISNRHLSLGPVLGNIVRELGLAGLDEYDNDEGAPGKNSSDWVVLARNRRALEPLIARREAARLSTQANLVLGMNAAPVMLPVPFARFTLWDDLEDDPEQRTWTDDYSNIIGVLRWWEKERKRTGWGK
jgi:hypothetical protein